MDTSAKIVQINELNQHIQVLKESGKEIAFTNGCFDILHYGHVTYLEKIKTENRILIIGLNSDHSIARIKGSNRPIIQQNPRARLLAGLACVDFVILFDEETPYELIKAIQPDVLIKGSDWKDKGIVGADIVESSGGRIEYMDYVENFSTTNIIEKILKTCQK